MSRTAPPLLLAAFQVVICSCRLCGKAKRLLAVDLAPRFETTDLLCEQESFQLQQTRHGQLEAELQWLGILEG